MTKPAAPLISTALRGRCPRCGKGSLFEGYIKVAPKCPVCGLGFGNNDTGDGPAFFVMMPLCILVAVSALVFDQMVAPPMWVHLLVWPTFIALAVGFSLRPVKAIMVGLQYRYRDVEQQTPE